MPLSDEANANTVIILIERMRSEVTERLTRMEGKQEALAAADAASQREADHRHRNMMQTMESFVPRREIEANEKAQDVKIKAIEEDVNGINKKMWAILLGILAAVGSSWLGAFGIHLKP